MENPDNQSTAQETLQRNLLFTVIYWGIALVVMAIRHVVEGNFRFWIDQIIVATALVLGIHILVLLLAGLICWLRKQAVRSYACFLSAAGVLVVGGWLGLLFLAWIFF